MSRFPSSAVLSAAIAAICGVFEGSPVWAAKPSEPPQHQSDWPTPVADWLDQAKRDCPAGFQDRGAVDVQSLTGDGQPGYIADPHKLTCAGSPHLYGADGPASIELFVTRPSGQVVHAAGILALGYKVVTPAGGPPVLAFETHNAADRAGSIDSYRWDGSGFTLINQSSMAEPPAD